MAYRTLTCLGVVALSLAGPQAARPARAWGNFVALKNLALESDPSCAAFLAGGNTAVCAAMGAGAKLFYAAWSGKAWSAWAAQGAAVISAPSCTNAGSNEVICASRNTSLKLVVELDEGGSFQTPLILPVTLASAPSCAWLTGNSVMCAGRSPSGQLVSAVYNGGAWSTASWTVPPAGPADVYSPVSCGPGGFTQGQAVCAWLTTASEVAVDLFTGTGWSGELNTGGTATNPPICIAVLGGQPSPGTACFATGTNSALFYNLYDGAGWGSGSWAQWESMQGLVHFYSCAPYGQPGGDLSLACGVTGLTTSGFYTNEFVGSGWSGWVQQGNDTYIGNPSCCVLNATGSVMCVVTKQNGQAESLQGP